MKILTTLLICLMLCSCVSTKRLRNYQNTRQTSMSSELDQRLTHDMFLQQLQSKIKESLTEIKISLYQTSQQVEPQTGKPPLCAEIQISNKTQEQTQSETQQTDSTNISLNQNSTLHQQEEIKEQENKKRYNTNQMLFFVFIGMFFYWVIKK